MPAIPAALEPPGPAPTGPGAEEYVAPAPAMALDADPLRETVTREMAGVAAALRRRPPVRDGRLDRVADDLARATAPGERPSDDLISFLLAHYGMIEPEVDVVVVSGDEVSIVEAVRPQLRRMLEGGPHERLGVGVLRGNPEVMLVVALQEQNVELGPVPRRLRSGMVVSVRGRLRGGYRSPELIVAGPDGAVKHIPFLRARGVEFEGRLRCEIHDVGVLQVEIAGQNERGPRVLANFPVYCQVDPPRRPPVLAADRRNQSPAEAEAELLALVNRERKALGLRLVNVDRRLAEVARAHSREMAATGIVAHVLPRTGTVRDRLGVAGLEPELAAENVGFAASAAQAHRGLMGSPGHRANIISPRFSVVGIGVVAGREEDGIVPLYITQVFATAL